MTAGVLAGRHWGNAGRRALLLHGSTSSSATWWQIGPSLAEGGWTVSALDLPSHGASPALGAPLVPSAAAAAVAATICGSGFDLIVGHALGAAVALVLTAADPRLARKVVLEELPGPASVDWEAEAGAVRHGAPDASRDMAAAVARTRAGQPRWSETDCRHACADLAACREEDVADGLILGPQWIPPALLTGVQTPALLLLAQDVPGVNRLEDATALRGTDRTRTAAALRARTRVLDAGHCLHRDDPTRWIEAVTTFAANR